MPLVQSARLPAELDRPEMALLRVVAYATFDVSPRITLAMLSQGLLSFLPGLLGLPWVFCWLVAGRLNKGNYLLVLLTPLAFELLLVSVWLFRLWRRWWQLQSGVVVLTDAELVFYHRGAWRCNDPFATISLERVGDARVEPRRMGCLSIPMLMIDRPDIRHRGFPLIFALPETDLETLRDLVLKGREAMKERTRNKVEETLVELGVDVKDVDLDGAQEFCVPYTPTTRSGTFIALGDDLASESSGTSFRIPINIVYNKDDISSEEAVQQPPDSHATTCQQPRGEEVWEV